MADTGQSDVSPVEAQILISLVEDVVTKLQFLSSIAPDVVAHREELSQHMGEEISSIINQQRELEQRFEELIHHRATLKGLANKSKFKDNQEEIREVTRQLRQSTKALCRNLKDSPNVAENLLKVQTERGALASLLAKTLKDLRSGHFNTLLTSVLEEKAQHDTLVETIAREKEATAQLKTLQREIESEKKEHEKAMASREEEVSKLKAEYRALKDKTHGETSFLKKEAEAKGSQTTRLYQQQTDDLNLRIEKLKKQLEIEVRVNKETEEFLKRKTQKLNEDNQQWSMRHERDIEEYDRKIERLRGERTLALTKLSELRERARQEEEAEKRRQEHEKWMSEMDHLTLEVREARKKYSIVKIQRVVKAYMESKKKRSKGKRGKGKGGKKGKGKRKR